MLHGPPGPAPGPSRSVAGSVPSGGRSAKSSSRAVWGRSLGPPRPGETGGIVVADEALPHQRQKASS